MIVSFLLWGRVYGTHLSSSIERLQANTCYAHFAWNRACLTQQTHGKANWSVMLLSNAYKLWFWVRPHCCTWMYVWAESKIVEKFFIPIKSYSILWNKIYIQCHIKYDLRIIWCTYMECIENWVCVGLCREKFCV